MKKSKGNFILKILGMLFVIFMALFIASSSGYYESKIRDKVVITEAGIKEFESKVQNGENIDINAFLNKKQVDYSSPMSNLGDKVTDGIEKLVSDGMNFVTKVLKSLF